MNITYTTGMIKKIMIDTKQIAVIGGGAAGMMAASAALESGAAVTLFEQNKILGKKIRITGKGRCNVTNDCSAAELLQNVTRNSKFLYSAVYRFTPSDAMDFFEGCGVPLKTERGRRVFPVSDKAADISLALENKIKELGCKIIHSKISDIIISNNKITGVSDGSRVYNFDAVIIACGGISYPGTGSHGDGFTFAKRAGHSITPLTPSLVPVVTKEKTADMMGLSLKNVALSVYRGDKKIIHEQGEMLFTHFGVSGPLVLSASAHMQQGDIKSYRLIIDLKPALSYEELDARVLSDFKKYAARDFVNALDDLLPRKIIPEVIRRSGIPERIKVSAVSRDMRHRLIDVLKGFTLSVASFRPINEAIITCGGVNIKEVNPKTMMSKITSGLFFAGEMLDVDAYTGGYNLQIAWSTGRLAGIEAAKFIESEEK